jgi:hypothetical protein
MPLIETIEAFNDRMSNQLDRNSLLHRFQMPLKTSKFKVYILIYSRIYCTAVSLRNHPI